MSTILASTFTETQADTAFATNCSLDGRPPEGFTLTCKGLSTEGNGPGTVGVIFQLVVPSGYTLDQTGDGRTGSVQNPQYGSGYDEWILGVNADGGRGGTYYMELWFTEDDVNSDTWSIPFAMTIKAGKGNSTYTYVFTKGGSGDGN